MSFKLIDNHLAPAEGEVVVRTYHCTQLSPIFAAIGFKVAGYLTVTNKRIVFFAAGSSLFGISGNSKLYNEVPIADVANLSLSQGTRFSLLRLILAHIVIALLAVFVVAAQAVVLHLLGLGRANNPYAVRFGIWLQLVIAIWLILRSLRFCRDDARRLVLASLGGLLLNFNIGYALKHGGTEGILPSPYLGGIILSGLAASCYMLYCLYWFVRREYLTMDISSKSGMVTPIRIVGVSWLGRINIVANYARNMAPAVDAAAMFKELGAIVTDIQTLGDHGVEKWLRAQADVADGSAAREQQAEAYRRKAGLYAVVAVLLAGVFVGGESLWYSYTAKKTLALRMRSEVEAARKSAEAEKSVREWVPNMWTTAESEARAGETAFSNRQFQVSMDHWSQAIKTYSEMSSAAVAMKNAFDVQLKYKDARTGVYLQETVSERLKPAILMTEFSALMTQHPISNDDWKVVNTSTSKAKLYAEQEKWQQSVNAWIYADAKLPPSIQLMRADLWVGVAEDAIKQGDARRAYDCTVNSLKELPLYSVAIQRQQLAINMLRYAKMFSTAINNGTVTALSMDALVAHLNIYGGTAWGELKILVESGKTLVSQNEWEKSAVEWEKALRKQPDVILALQMEKLEAEARRGNWEQVSILADNILMNYSNQFRANELKDKAESIQAALASENTYQKALSSALVREVASEHIKMSDMNDFIGHMDRYGREEWKQVKDAIQSAEAFARDERGVDSSNAWMMASVRLPFAVRRMRAEIWMERAEQEAANTNWAKVLLFTENALKEKKDHVLALQLRDKADGIEEMRFMRLKYNLILDEAAEHLADLGCKTNDQETLFAYLSQFGGIPWETVKNNIKKAEDFEKQGRRVECVASWVDVCDVFPSAATEMRAQYWVEKAKSSVHSNLGAKVDIYIQRALLEKPDHIPAQQLKSQAENIQEILRLRSKYDLQLSKAAERMPDINGVAGDQAGLITSLAKYGGPSGRIVAENISKALVCEKEEKWSDCLTAWRLVVETFPLALRQARSGFWVIIAENNARDKLWDKVINASEKALAEDPENERAKELKIDAQTEVRAKAEAEKKVNPPPAPAVSSASQGQPENEKTLTKAASTGSGGIDPNEEEVIKVLLSGGTSFVPQGKASFDTVAINELLVMVSSVQREIKATDLVISQNISRGYLASVDGLWKKAADFAGEFGERVRNAVWQVIEKQLVKILDTTIKGTILASPPSQQARERREVIKLISRIDGITNGKISACSEQDALRIGVTQFFTEGFFNNALLTEKVGDDVFLESHVPWIKDLFAKNREKSGLGSVK